MRLKEIRLENGYSCKQIANAIGISEKTYRGYEKDCWKIRADKLALLVEFFDISAGYILGLTDNPIRH